MLVLTLVSASLVVLCLPGSSAFSRGAPRHACRNLKPMHGSEPQASDSPYTLSAELKGHNGSVAVGVELSWNESVPFKGFLLHAKDANDQLFGQFVKYPQDTVFLECNRAAPRSSITHSNGDPKTLVNFLWTPPEEYNGSVVFKATVVRSEQVFWMGHVLSLASLEPEVETGGVNSVLVPTWLLPWLLLYLVC